MGVGLEPTESWIRVEARWVRRATAATVGAVALYDLEKNVRRARIRLSVSQVLDVSGRQLNAGVRWGTEGFAEHAK